MNKVILTGRAASEPEHRQTQSGASVATFRMAVQRRVKNAEGKHDADFFTVICWRGLADLVKMYLAKGDRCSVVGMIQNRSWTDNSGNKRYATEIIADEVEFMGGQQRESDSAPPEQPGFVQVDDDELPF